MSHETIWDRLRQLKNETDGDASIAIRHTNSITLDSLRKMTEAIFHETTTKVKIFTTVRLRFMESKQENKDGYSSYNDILSVKK